MDGFRRIYECLENLGSQVSHQITDDVHHDDTRRSELYVKPPFQTDNQRHRHGEDRQKQFVFNSGKPAAKCHCGMQKGEKMDDPRSFYVADGAHYIAFETAR